MTAYIRKDRLETVELDGNCIVLNPPEFNITTLNGVGGFCWSLLGEACTVEQLVQSVRSHYEIGNESIEQDLEAFIAHLLDCGLIRHAS